MTVLVFVTVLTFLQYQHVGLLSHCGAWASCCSGFSSCLARTSRCEGFRSCGSQALEHRLSNCGLRDQLLCSKWDLPRPGVKPVSPALACRFFTTESPGKPQNVSSWCTSPHFPSPKCLPWRRSRSTLCDPMDCIPGNFPGKTTGMGCHVLLQGIFLTQGSKLGLLRCRQRLYLWAIREALNVYPSDCLFLVSLLLLSSRFSLGFLLHSLRSQTHH